MDKRIFINGHLILFYISHHSTIYTSSYTWYVWERWTKNQLINIRVVDKEKGNKIYNLINNKNIKNSPPLNFIYDKKKWPLYFVSQTTMSWLFLRILFRFYNVSLSHKEEKLLNHFEYYQNYYYYYYKRSPSKSHETKVSSLFTMKIKQYYYLWFH